MPKTYNTRQLENMKLEAEYAPPIEDVPDLTRHIRPFSRAEVADLVDRITTRIAADKRLLRVRVGITAIAGVAMSWRR